MKEQRKSNQNCMLLCLCVLLFCTSGAWADFTFGEPVNLGPPINTPRHEGMPVISLDGLSLYFVGGDPNGGGDIMVAKRKSTKDEWEQPTNLGPIVNSSWFEGGPYISAEGLTLYFFSNRPGGLGELDIWVTTRPTLDDDWTPPVNLGAPINSSQPALSPCISTNGLELYFARIVGVNYPNRLYVSRRASVQDAWSQPVELHGIRANGPDQNPSLSADGLTLFFNSWRGLQTGAYGQSDIYMTTRPTLDADWSGSVNIGPPVNSTYAEYGPHVSSDGRTLYFSHFPDNPAWIRPGGMGGEDIWQASIDPIVDFNSDGNIDTDDLLIMINNWDTDDSTCDIGPMPWGDGVVDAQDLLVLAESMIELANQEQAGESE